MSKDKHPDVLYKRVALVSQKYLHWGVKPTYDELIGRVVHSAAKYYWSFMTNKLTILEETHGDDVWDKNKINIPKELQKLTSNFYESWNIEDSLGNETKLSAL